MYHEWRKVENKSSDKGSKISRQQDIPFPEDVEKRFQFNRTFRKNYSQYSGFKKACIKAMNSKGDAATSHVDWSENV